jgi:hypothetical protein
MEGIKKHFINLSKHKFMQKHQSSGLLLDIVKDSRRWVNKRLQMYYKNALEDQNEFERLVYEQQVGFPKNPLMSPVVLSVTTCSNASSSLISNLSVQKVQICEDISQTLMMMDSRSISDNLSHMSHLSDNNSSRVSRSPLHFPSKGEKGLNLYTHARNVESEEFRKISFHKSKSSKNSFKKLPHLNTANFNFQNNINRHKKSGSSNLQTIKKQNSSNQKMLSLTNSVKKSKNLTQKLKMKIRNKVQAPAKKSLKFQFQRQRGMDSGGSSKIPILFDNRLDCKWKRGLIGRQ